MTEENINQGQGAGNRDAKASNTLANDHNIIELDDLSGSVSHKPLSASEKKKRIKELKGKKAADERAKLMADRADIKRLKKEQGVGNGKKIVAVVVVFAILAGVFAYFHFRKSGLQGGKKTVELVSIPDSVVVDTVFDEAPSPEKAPEAVKQKTVKMGKETSPKAKMVVAASKPSKGKLSVPCWIIGVAAVETEKLAEKDIKKLADKGLIAGTYWIPDYFPGGKQFYKVYVGPFTSKAEANAKLSEVKAFSPQAYVMQIK